MFSNNNTIEPNANKLIRGIKRPNWICSNVKQQVILVRDASYSMKGEKADHASRACIELIQELASPDNKEGFYVAVIDFNSVAKLQLNWNKASDLKELLGDICINNSTNIGAGLRKAEKLLEVGVTGILDIDDVSFLRPVIILFSDGEHNVGVDPRKIAPRVKAKSDVVTICFGNDADEDLMREIATTPQHCYKCNSGKELRAFLASVGKTMTATMVQKENATQALSDIKQ